VVEDAVDLRRNRCRGQTLRQLLSHARGVGEYATDKLSRDSTRGARPVALSGRQRVAEGGCDRDFV